MSELKAFNMPRYAGQFTLHEVYLKSEADKVIAEKDKEITELKEQVHEYALGSYVMQARAEKEARHDKYKRCLAMARWCMTEYIQSKCLDFTNTEQWYWRRWHIRWRELAEKFKEAK